MARNLIRAAIPAALIAVGALSASPAMASQYGYTIPSGLPTSSPQAAASVALDFADSNSQYAGMLARESGVSSYVRADYNAVGWSYNAAGTLTTATNLQTGSIVAMRGQTNVKTVVVRNNKTGVSVKIMVKCGQIRVTIGQPVRTQTIRKSRKMYVVKKIDRTVKLVCPSGQPVSVRVKTLVRGWAIVKGRVTVRSTNAAVEAFVAGKVGVKIKQSITLRCGLAPNVPVTLVPGPGNTTIVQQVIVCGNGSVVVGNGNATNVVGDNCNEVVIVTSPVVTPPPPPPPPPVNKPPTGQIKVPQHLIAGSPTNGKTSVCGISDPNGDPVDVSFRFTDENGTVLDLKVGSVFTDGACKSQMFRIPDRPMSLHIYATLSDGEGGQTVLFDRTPVVANPDPD